MPGLRSRSKDPNRCTLISIMYPHSPLIPAPFLPAEKRQDEQSVLAAVRLLKTEKLRGMLFTVETESIFNREEESAKTMEAVKIINEMVTAALTTVSRQPLLLPLYKMMMTAVVDTLPRGRIFENVMEKVFVDVEDFLKKQEENEARKAEAAARAQPGENPAVELEREKNALKKRELEQKMQLEQQRVDLEKSKFATDTMLQMQKLRQQAIKEAGK